MTAHRLSSSGASTSVGTRLMDVYRRLYARYGPQHWWPGDGPFETIVGAILTQNTAWVNVERAMNGLKEAQAMSLRRIRELSQDDLAAIIRSSGYFNSKARKLKAFAHHVGERYDDDLDAMFNQELAPLRIELLSIYGIGRETADDIILYAAGKPSFVIDSYTIRILRRLGLVAGGTQYDDFQALFHRNLDPDPDLFNEYHALLDCHAVLTCRKSPLCEGCCLLEICPAGRESLQAVAGVQQRRIS